MAVRSTGWAAMWTMSFGVAYSWLVNIGIVEPILRPSLPNRFVKMTGGTNDEEM
jgi:hypothetical protein